MEQDIEKENRRLRDLAVKLKAENERLKEENFNFEEIVKLCRCEQYQQTLQEIKEIAEETVKTTGMISAGFIIQKITKAEEE